MSDASRHTDHAAKGRGLAALAFTLTELLVVIIIITILAAVAIPSFSSMMYSSESALAATRLTAALRAGRDAAVRSSGDADAALAFFYEPGGRLTIVPCLKIGELDDAVLVNGSATNATVRRDVFVPVDFMEPVQLPRNWMVRGYAPAGSIDHANGDWYEDVNGQQRYASDPNRGDWVFPETGFYVGGTTESVSAAAANLSGGSRQTFIIRFQAGSGLMMTSGNDALIVAPRPSGVGRNSAPFGGFRIDRATDLRRFVRKVLLNPMIDESGATVTVSDLAPFRQKLLGDQASDTVLARAVGQVALYDENKLAAGLASRGVQIDRNSGCIYVLDPVNPAPMLPIPAGGETPAQLSMRINRWIEGDTNGDQQYNRQPAPGITVDEPQARVFTIDRYTGEARPVEIEPGDQP